MKAIRCHVSRHPSIHSCRYQQSTACTSTSRITKAAFAASLDDVSNLYLHCRPPSLSWEVPCCDWPAGCGLPPRSDTQRREHRMLHPLIHTEYTRLVPGKKQPLAPLRLQHACVPGHLSVSAQLPRVTERTTDGGGRSPGPQRHNACAPLCCGNPLAEPRCRQPPHDCTGQLL